MVEVTERVLTAVYDLQVSPPTFEVFSFFAEAERYRIAMGFTSIDVVFIPGPNHGFRNDQLPPSVEERESMLHRVCVSGARLLPSVRNVSVLKERIRLQGEFFPPDWTNEIPRACYGPRFQKGGLPCLESTTAAREEIAHRYRQRYSTITLRQAEYWPNRNSDRHAWERAARELQRADMPAIVIPDTHGSGLEGFENFTPAAWDVDLRLALYEGAKLNLGVANGPMAMLMYAKRRAPYIVFQKPSEDSATPYSFLQAHGVTRGEQWTDAGLTVWGDDSAENVLAAIQTWNK